LTVARTSSSFFAFELRTFSSSSCISADRLDLPALFATEQVAGAGFQDQRDAEPTAQIAEL
jgi:hypothetical protein